MCSSVTACHFRYYLPRGLTAAPDVACRTSFESKTVDSSKELQSSLDVNAHVSGGGWGVSFSASAGYKEASSTVQSGKYKLIMSTASCKYYFAKLNYLDLPELSPEVMEWIGRMNHSLATRGVIDDTLVYDFVDYFGTHIPSEMVYGARFTYENKVTSSNFKTMSSRDISVDVQASYSGAFNVGGGFGLSDSQKKAAEEFRENSVTSTISIGAPPPYNGDAMTWASTVKDTPVPVEFDLIPIYELFDNRTLSLRQHFGSETSRMIRNKILGIASKYCRMLLAKGVKVQCNDDSVIKIENYAMKSVGLFQTDGTQYLNVTTDECIDECMRRKTCVMTTVYPERHTETRNGRRCRLDDHDEALREMTRCDDCKSFIDPNGLTSPMGLKNLRYASSVSRHNKMDVRGSPTYDQLKQFCSVVCSSDPRCTGFEISNQTQFNYNCATYSEHNSNFVTAGDFQFETYIMPDLAKRNFRELNIQNMELLIVGVSIESAFSFKLPEMKCNEQCESHASCLVSSSIHDTSDLCINIMNEQNSGTMSVKEHEMSTLKIFTERAYPAGWVNVSLPNAYIGSASETSGLTFSNRTGVDFANDCGSWCSSDILCRFVFWDSNGRCVKFSSASLTTHQRIEISTPFQATEESGASQTILMIPNHRTKIRKLRMAN